MFAKGSSSITLKDLYSKISDEDIVQKYFGVEKVPYMILSPLRREKNPSFGFFYGKDGNIFYKDFVTGNKGSIIKLLQEYFRIPYNDIIDMLIHDFKGYNITYKPITKISEPLKVDKRATKTFIDLKVKIRDFKPYDIEYWASYGISEKWLKWANIYPIQTLFIFKTDGKGNLTKHIVRPDKLAYSFVEFKDDKESFKIYQPYSIHYKWLNNHNSSVWDLWDKLPKQGDKLIITSSRKDAVCLWANTGIPSVALQSESHLPKPHVVRQLINRFKNIYVLYDNDLVGQTYSEQLCEKYNFNFIEIPWEYESKDPSDTCKNHGVEVFKIVINQLINK